MSVTLSWLQLQDISSSTISDACNFNNRFLTSQNNHQHIKFVIKIKCHQHPSVTVEAIWSNDCEFEILLLRPWFEVQCWSGFCLKDVYSHVYVYIRVTGHVKVDEWFDRNNPWLTQKICVVSGRLVQPEFPD